MQADRKKTKGAVAALKQALKLQRNFSKIEDARRCLAELDEEVVKEERGSIRRFLAAHLGGILGGALPLVEPTNPPYSCTHGRHEPVR